MLMIAVVRIPKEGVASFQAYEDSVIPLQAEHGATMQRRLRTPAGTTEVHVMSFPSQAAFAAYIDDPRRAACQRLFRASGATMDAFEVDDVPT